MRMTLILASFTVLLACSGGSSGGGSMCDASTCNSLLDQIVQHGGGSATCVEPTPEFATICQAWQTCVQQCRQ